MGISFGSVSKKPYVGSKEVTEAYVGTKKVYSAAPPIYYGFLGAENDYVIAEWCQLVQGAAIAKDQGIYRIGLSRTGQGSGIVSLGAPKAQKLKFTARLVSTLANVGIVYKVGGVEKSYGVTGLNTQNFTLVDFTLPENTTEVKITCGSAYNLLGVYIDAIRFETE